MQFLLVLRGRIWWLGRHGESRRLSPTQQERRAPSLGFSRHRSWGRLSWGMKITGAGNGQTKWQVASGSHASPGAYYDITDEISETATIYSDHSRSGAERTLLSFPAPMDPPGPIRLLFEQLLQRTPSKWSMTRPTRTIRQLRLGSTIGASL